MGDKRKRAILGVLTVGFVVACASGPLRDCPASDVARRATVVVATNNGVGMGCLMGSKIVLTAKHVVENTEWIVCAGSIARVAKVAENADIALLLLDNEPNDIEPVKVGVMVTGTAIIYAAAGNNVAGIPVTISNRGLPIGHRIDSYTPIHGQSGSPVVQGNKLVGVVTKLDFPAGGYFEGVEKLFPELQQATDAHVKIRATAQDGLQGSHKHKLRMMP